VQKHIKVMESIIASDIKSFLFSNNLISNHQFGFRPGHNPGYVASALETMDGGPQCQT